MIQGGSADSRTVVEGLAEGPVVFLAVPLSLWGGLDLDRGTICDTTHPDVGRTLAGAVLVMPQARGSSSSSSALVEAARRGLAPRAIVLGAPDPILTIGALVADFLYGLHIPVVTASPADLDRLRHAAYAIVDAGPGGARITVPIRPARPEAPWDRS
ncbi:aconitase X swivel domain-containing protein [Gluconacetobacter tumulisoli]|uniref:DUF126 domain-containing protein n=1 Tax=Gluconacetobacter tumulisoli TaxID=1286189 RepID=A0A7W4PKH7_9PROT|nr:DUF126 domain-containing protein [Gluconacetobacter tumulisoli]MBB2201085.1 DUF126 domain-containing protein [Gluconacetobacter tumulisoli]